MKRQIFNYDKYIGNDYTYYGFHNKNGRYHIDTKRIKKLGLASVFPDALFCYPRNTHYFIPKYKNRSDYAINILTDIIKHLRDDWNYEYKTVINKITTPKEVKDDYRLNSIAGTTDMNDLDDIEMNAMFAGIKREIKYNAVIKSIHLQYLQKVFADYFRALLVTIKDRGYTNTKDFSFNSLCTYVQEKLNSSNNKTNPLFKLSHFKFFDALNKIDNFLKHNTYKSYLSLANNPFEKDENHKKFLSTYVYTSKEMNRKYENGMYSGNWLKIGPTFVDEILDNLLEFSKEFCKLLYNEDYQEAYWNSEEELIKILRTEIIYPSYPF